MQIKEKKERKVPQRRCVGCGERFPKPALVRVVRSPSGEVALDFTGRAAGRGTYICRSAECFRKARRAGRFEQNLGCAVSPEIYDAIEGELDKSGSSQ